METVSIKDYGVDVNVAKETYCVPEWLAFKVYSEYAEKHGEKFEGYDTRVCAILSETEKAYKVALGTPIKYVVGWCSKKFIKIDEEPADGDETRLCNYEKFREVCKAYSGFFG